MTTLPLETQAQLAGAVAVLCLFAGAAAWELAVGSGKWLGRATIAGGVFQLMAFSRYAVNQYEVALARVSIPAMEVASGSSGRERTIERVEWSDGTTIERERIPGWRFTAADRAAEGEHRAGHQRASDWAMLERAIRPAECDVCCEECRCEAAGIADCILGVPGCSCGNRGDSVAIGQGNLVSGNNF